MNKDYQRQVTDDSLYQDRVDAYLRGEMSQAEREVFEHDLKSDPALREVYELTRAIKRALGERQEQHAMIRRWAEERQLREQSVQRAVRGRSRRNWTIALSAAACLLVGFFVIKPLWFYSSSGSAPSHKYEIEPDYCPVMGIDDDADYCYADSGDADYCYADSDEYSDINLINRLIQNGEYASALAQTDSLEAIYRNAIAQYDGNKALSVPNEEDMEETKRNLYDLTWLRINLLVTLKQYDNAKALLRDFTFEQGQYQEQARDMYQSINRQMLTQPRTGTPPKPNEK